MLQKKSNLISPLFLFLFCPLLSAASKALLLLSLAAKIFDLGGQMNLAAAASLFPSWYPFPVVVHSTVPAQHRACTAL